MSEVTKKPAVGLINGHATTTSNKIAEHFGKNHKSILRAIQNLGCSSEFTERNFAPSEFKDSTNRTLPAYTITRDGFVFLAMGFTGKEAAQWKEAYIKAFNELEKYMVAHLTNMARSDKPIRNASMLNSKPHYYYPTQNYESPLISLLNQLRRDGHEITAPYNEAMLMRTTLQQLKKSLDEIGMMEIPERESGAK